MEQLLTLWVDVLNQKIILFNRRAIDMIYLLTAIGLTPGGSRTVHIYTQITRRATQFTK